MINIYPLYNMLLVILIMCMCVRVCVFVFWFVCLFACARACVHRCLVFGVCVYRTEKYQKFAILCTGMLCIVFLRVFRADIRNNNSTMCIQLTYEDLKSTRHLLCMHWNAIIALSVLPKPFLLPLLLLFYNQW